MSKGRARFKVKIVKNNENCFIVYKDMETGKAWRVDFIKIEKALKEANCIDIAIMVGFRELLNNLPSPEKKIEILQDDPVNWFVEALQSVIGNKKRGGLNKKQLLLDELEKAYKSGKIDEKTYNLLKVSLGLR